MYAIARSQALARASSRASITGPIATVNFGRTTTKHVLPDARLLLDITIQSGLVPWGSSSTRNCIDAATAPQILTEGGMEERGASHGTVPFCKIAWGPF